MRTFVFVIVLAFFVGVVPAEAQYYGNPAQDLIQGNLQMVNNARYGGGYNHQPQYGYGNPYQQQAGYRQQPNYQQSSQRRMGTLERSILGGAIGALGARTVTKNGRAIAGTALAGVLIGALTGRQKNQPQQQSQYTAQQSAPNMGAEPWPTQQNSQQQNQTLPQQEVAVTVKNCTRFAVEVFDWDISIGTLQPGESAQIPASTRGGYRALASISLGGQTTRSWADTRFVDSTDSTILFVEPK